MHHVDLGCVSGGGNASFECFETGWTDFAGGDSRLRIHFGEDERFASGSCAAIENIVSVAGEFRDELGALFLDPDFAILEGLCGGDIAGDDAASLGKDCTGSQLNPFPFQPFFDCRRVESNGEFRLLLAMFADSAGGFEAVDLSPAFDQPDRMRGRFGEFHWGVSSREHCLGPGLGGELAQNGVDHFRSELVPRSFGERYRFPNSSMRRNAIEIQKLVSAEP